MASTELNGPDEVRANLGRHLGHSDWITIDQDRVNLFADATGDHQWIHVDVERAERESPFGTTIAHGNLTLAMIDGFRDGLVTVDRDVFQLGVNLGWNRVRFPAPVPAGSRSRASAELVSSEQREGGWIENVTRFTVEIEGGDKPCCVADSVTRLLQGPNG